ncbi:MAG: V-type ATPase subunit [Thermoproteota archaeon]|nr:V-type ATPase subunit [Candidatus Brockarchaeota archaeon]
MLKIGDYAYVEARLTSLDAQLRSAKNREEACSMLYSGLSNLTDFLPGDVRPFVEWWILRNDLENIKDAAAQILGSIRYGFSRPFLRIRKETLSALVNNRDMVGLMDFLSKVFDGIRKEDFENLDCYGCFASSLDKFYFQRFSDFLPGKPDGELARMLVAVKVDLLNLRLLKRVKDLKRFFIPCGFLSIEDIANERKLDERMFELYGVRDRSGLQNYYRDICRNYDSGFAGLMGFIISHELLIEKGV